MKLKALGIGNLMKFSFLVKPKEEAFVRSLESLFSLNAIDKCCNLTPNIGAILAELPLKP